MTQQNSATRQRAQNRLRLELAALAYLDALEADDLDAIAALWERACGDAELADVLTELSQGIADEGEPSPGWEADTARVSQLLKLHLASSSPPPPPAGPITAGDVAARIAGDDLLLGRLGPEERNANAALLANRTPLPTQLGTASLAQWSAGLPVHMGKNYWAVFRHAAVMMTMSRGHRTGLLMAARRKPPADDSSRPPGGGAS